MYRLSVTKKHILRTLIVQGANRYYRYYCNKEFLIVCDDGYSTTVTFVKKEFKHLSGIRSNLSDSRFFQMAYNLLLAEGNIESEQKYNWSTLYRKATQLNDIYYLLYSEGNKTLLLDALSTHTRVFPIAIRNDAKDMCIGFISNIHRGHSLRKARNSHDAQRIKRVTAIFSKAINDVSYDELVYLKNATTICNNHRITNLLSDKLRNRIMVAAMNKTNN